MTRFCKHPCPGCGKTDYYGLKGTLCMDCKETLKIGKNVQTARKLKVDAKTGSFLIPWAYYAFPHFSHGSGHKKYKLGEFEGHAKDVYEYALYQLIGLLSEQSHQHEGPALIKYESPGHDDKHVPVIMRKDLAALISEIYSAVVRMTENAYREGREDGENLIGRLASGDLTIRELNKESINATKKDDDDE